MDSVVDKAILPATEFYFKVFFTFEWAIRVCSFFQRRSQRVFKCSVIQFINPHHRSSFEIWWLKNKSEILGEAVWFDTQSGDLIFQRTVRQSVPWVLKSDPRFAARVFSLRPNTCRPAADETKFPVAREKKPLVPRVDNVISGYDVRR